MENKNYLPRIIDSVIEKNMNVFGGIQIRGPKWCGKTTSAKQFSNSVVDFGDPDERSRLFSIMDVKPSALLKGEKPILVDEWQDAPSIYDAVKKEIDNNWGQPGQFILTGSTISEKKKLTTEEGREIISHTGTGRIAKLDMRTMSLFESGESNGLISLEEVINGTTDIDGINSSLTIEMLVDAICRGGWPQALSLKKEYWNLPAKNYLRDICNEDINRFDNTKRDAKIAHRIIKSISRNISTLVSDKTILKDLSTDNTISRTTYYDYINVLKGLFVVYEVDAWSPNIRSATSIRSSSKIELADPSIAVAALGLSPEVLMSDMRTLGFLFENLCARDLQVYSTGMNGKIEHYHDRFGLESDFVLHLDNGKTALIECKLGQKGIESGSENLKKLADLITEKNKTIDRPEEKVKAPDVLIILTGGKIAYTDKNGVKIIPIGCLKN